MNLTLHIGLPKTGTSSLQSVFWELWPETNEVSGRTLCDELYFGGKQENGYRDWESDSWYSDASFFAARLKSRGDDWLLSNENFSQWRAPDKAPWPLMDGASERTGQAPIADFLSQLGNVLREEGITLKVIIGIRERASFLASLYCELAHVFAHPSQFDFVERATRYDPFLAFEETGLKIQEAVGHGNLHVLKVEDSPKKRLRSIEDFLSVKLPPVPTDRNVRRAGKDLWVLPSSLARSQQFISINDSLREEIDALYQGHEKGH